MSSTPLSTLHLALLDLSMGVGNWICSNSRSITKTSSFMPHCSRRITCHWCKAGQVPRLQFILGRPCEVKGLTASPVLLHLLEPKLPLVAGPSVLTHPTPMALPSWLRGTILSPTPLSLAVLKQLVLGLEPLAAPPNPVSPAGGSAAHIPPLKQKTFQWQTLPLVPE
uniref:Uncharacterized protein n=1 Tax=Caliciviridae sp. TaxID=1916234 RepID=A0A7D3QLW9_9CALI|nr:MAG: hypothetical protein [Caliciviridae sp.]